MRLSQTGDGAEFVCRAAYSERRLKIWLTARVTSFGTQTKNVLFRLRMPRDA